MSVDNVGYYSTGGDINTFSINPVMSSTDQFDVAFQPLGMVYNIDNDIPSYVTGAYDCVNGSCVPALGGPFDTKPECIRSCGIKPAPPPYVGGNYTCTPQGCTKAYGGEYSSLGDCRRVCGYVPTPAPPPYVGGGWNCDGHQCNRALGGKYETLLDCMHSCNPNVPRPSPPPGIVGYECHTMGGSGQCLPTKGSTQSLAACRAICNVPRPSPSNMCSKLKSATYNDAQSYGSLLAEAISNVNSNPSPQDIYDACVLSIGSQPKCQADLNRFCTQASGSY